MFQLQELLGVGEKYIGIFINVAKIDGNKILHIILNSWPIH